MRLTIESTNGNKWQDIVFERFLLPIVQKECLQYKEAKASEGDSPRMSENTVSCHNGNGDAYKSAPGEWNMQKHNASLPVSLEPGHSVGFCCFLC